MSSQARRRFRLGDVIRKLSEAGVPVTPPAPESPAAPAPPGPAPRQPPHLERGPAEHIRPGAPPQHAPIAGGPPQPPAGDTGTESFDVFRYLGVILRRKAVILAVTAIVTAVAAISYVTAPRYYTAHARLLFSPGYQELTTDYVGAWQNWISRERFLYTHLELMKSRAVLALLSENLGNTVTPGAVAAGLTIERGKTLGEPNDIIEVSLRHPDAQTARDVVNELCRTYIEYRRDVNAQEQTRLILKLEAQIERQQRDLTERENALREFRERNAMVKLTDETSVVVSQVSSMEVALQQTQLDLVETRDRLQGLRSSIGQQEINVVQSMTYDNAYQSRLADLELQLSTLSAEYSPEHYKVRMVKQQIDTLKRAIESDVQSQVARQTTFVKNPVRQSLLEELVRLTIHKSALETRRTAQESLLAQLTAKLTQLPSLEQKYVTLQRETMLLEETLKLLKREYEQAKIARDSRESDLRVFELAQTPTARMSDQKPLNVLIGALVGLLLGIAVAFALEYLDQSIKDPAEAERLLEAPLLGFVPAIEPEETAGDDAAELAKSVLEPFRAVRANLKHVLAQHHVRSLVVCSAVKGEGKTTLVANLGIVFALDGRRVVIVDCDLRRPQIHKLFGLPRENGMTEYLTGAAETAALPKATAYQNLRVVTAGQHSPHPAELLGSVRLRTLVEELSRQTDIVLVDSPALLPVSDAVTMAPCVDGAIVVVRTLWTPARGARQALTQLRRLGTPILGGIVNGVSHGRGYYPYYYGYYGYYSYKYGYGEGKERPRSLRALGLAAEERLRESLQNARFSVPRMVALAGAFGRSLIRRVTFWLLLALAAGLVVTERLLRPAPPLDGTPEGIHRLAPEGAAQTLAVPVAPEVPTEQPVAPAPEDALAHGFAEWQNALQARDTAALLQICAEDGFAWEDSSGARTGPEAVRGLLSLAGSDSILVERDVRSLMPGASACTTVVRVVNRGGRRGVLLESVWRRNALGAWRVHSYRAKDTGPR